MEKIRHQENRERAEKFSFSEALKLALQDSEKHREQFVFSEIEERRQELEVIEAGIRNLELENFLREYEVAPISISLYREIIRQDESHSGLEAKTEKIYQLDVSQHFSGERLPEGYAYKGGAARALLLRTLGIDPTYNPRDVDVVRTISDEPYDGADKEIAKQFMPEDFATGYGVEYEEDIDRYFLTRDLSLNEVLATDKTIFVSEQCLRDTVRKIIRPTEFERYNMSDSGELGPKMLAKMLRFYAEALNRWDDVAFEGVEDWEFEQFFIKPFWLALQLDRAFDISEAVADRFVEELRARNQISNEVHSAAEAVDYLSSLMLGDNFYFRHATVDQFALEDSWMEDRFESLPKFQSHRKTEDI